MQEFIKPILLAIVLAPLAGSVLSGLWGKQIGRKGAHWVTILGVGLSFVLASYVLWALVTGQLAPVLW